MNLRPQLMKNVRACVKLRGMYQINNDVVEWADIPIIDISKAGTPEGRAELAPRARDAMRTQGFLYIINHGYTQTQVRVSDIAAHVRSY